MIDSMGSTLAGLSANLIKVNSAAHNVANVNTDEFKKDRVVIQSNKAGQPEAIISKVNAPGYIVQGPDGEVETSNVSLPEEAVNLKTGKIAYEANLKVLKAEDDMIESVLDIMA